MNKVCFIYYVIHLIVINVVHIRVVIASYYGVAILMEFGEIIFDYIKYSQKYISNYITKHTTHGAIIGHYKTVLILSYYSNRFFYKGILHYLESIARYSKHIGFTIFIFILCNDCINIK